MNADGTNSRASAVNRPLLAAGELALAVLTIATIASFARVFSGDEWVAPLLGAAVLAHATQVLMRRLGAGLVLTALVSVVLAGASITWTQYGDTTSRGLPTSDTRTLLWDDLNVAWELFGNVGAPTEPLTGFLVTGIAAVWVIAFLSDWAAFRLWSTVEAFFPAGVLFVFLAIVGDDQRRLALLTAFLVAVLAFTVVHRVARGGWGTPWLAGDGRRGRAAMLRTGGAIALLTLVAGLVVGPQLPGADDAAIIDLDQIDDDDQGDGGRVVISPMVDIRGRLVQQEDTEVFTVRSEWPSYWRLTSLDTFDGTVWTSRATYESASGTLPQDIPSGSEVELVTQQFEVTALGAVWVPAAFEPRELTNLSDNKISYEATSATLIADRSLSSSDGLSYTVTSAMPRFDAGQLASIPAQFPVDLVERYTVLPEDFNPRVADLAEQIVSQAGAATPFDQAKALQDFFRSGAFTYDLNVDTGHSGDRVERFLFEDRRGYCEQFAGTFAAMARHLGLPTRVAVGFTWGDRDEADPNLFRVRGEHAHAWPEVFLPGAGWVAFEPTPGRGAPDADYTGFEAMQDTSGPSTDPETLGEADALPTQPTPGDIPFQDFAADTGPGADVSSGSGDGAGAAGTAAIAVGASVGLIALYAMAIPAAKQARRRSRESRASGNRERIALAWTDATAAFALAGLPRRPTETHAEFAERAREHARIVRNEVSDLGRIASAAQYSPREPDDSTRLEASASAAEIRQKLTGRVTWQRRLLDRLDPRPLFRS